METLNQLPTTLNNIFTSLKQNQLTLKDFAFISNVKQRKSLFSLYLIQNISKVLNGNWEPVINKSIKGYEHKDYKPKFYLWLRGENLIIGSMYGLDYEVTSSDCHSGSFWYFKDKKTALHAKKYFGDVFIDYFKNS